MKDPVEIQKELIALEEKLNRQLEKQKEKAKEDIIEYIIARFNDVSYAKQPLSLTSNACSGKHPFTGSEYVSGSDFPCKHFDCMGIKKTRTTPEELKQTGQYFTGEIRYYVEKRCRHTIWQDFADSVFRIDKDCQLTCDQLMEIALCLKGYHHNVFTDSSWNGWSYDRD